jgi:hypothetical protein
MVDFGTPVALYKMSVGMTAAALAGKEVSICDT